MRVAAVLVACAVVGCAAPRAGAPTVVVPPRGAEAAGDPSRGGTERGDVELGLGAVVEAAAGVLVAVGGYQAARGIGIRRYCEDPASYDDKDRPLRCTGLLGGDPFVAAIVSSSLAFAFSVPVAVAGGFLLRRGVLTRRAWLKAQGAKNMSVRPWTNGQNAAGLSLGLRF